MKTVEGDLIEMALEGKFDCIAHGCNCFNTMGRGIALLIKKHFPEAWQADQATKKGDISKLGIFTFAYSKRYDLFVINVYSQYKYWGTKVKVDYKAIESSMRLINKYFRGRTIGLPMLGAGLAGGDWAIISKIIEKELANMDVTIVEWTRK